MSDEFLVKVHKLEQAAEDLDMFSNDAKYIQSEARDITISGNEWGMVGLGFKSFYDDYARQVDGHLTTLNQTLSSIEAAIEATALTYAVTDAALVAKIKALESDFPTISQGKPGASAGGGGGDEPDGAVKAFQDNTPFVSQTFKIIEHTSGDDWGLLGSDVGDAALTTVSTFFDPLGALVGAGVGFLVDYIEPLHKMLTMATGDDGAISDHRKAWKQVADNLRGLSHEMAARLSLDLDDWRGQASDQAHKRIGDFLQGVNDIGGEIGGITGILAVSASVMDTAMSALKDLISQLVEWLIVTWLAAQAAAPFSFGASEGAAAAATSAEVSTAVSRGGRIIQRLLAEFRRLSEAIGRILTRLSHIKGLSKLSDAKFGKDLLKDGKDAAEAARDGKRLPFGYDPVDAERAAADKIGGGLFQGIQDNDSKVPDGKMLEHMLNLDPNAQDDPAKRALDAINHAMGFEPDKNWLDFVKDAQQQDQQQPHEPSWVDKLLHPEPQPEPTEADRKAQDAINHALGFEPDKNWLDFVKDAQQQDQQPHEPSWVDKLIHPEPQPEPTEADRRAQDAINHVFGIEPDDKPGRIRRDL
ncbi:hypothetical protein AB0L06_12995 [Spirillospora sp. NPDC052269]